MKTQYIFIFSLLFCLSFQTHLSHHHSNKLKYQQAEYKIQNPEILQQVSKSKDLPTAIIFVSFFFIIFGLYVIYSYESVVSRNFFNILKIFEDSKDLTKDTPDNKFIIARGQMEIKEPLDEITIEKEAETQCLALKIKAEMFQWVEYKKQKENGEITYEYKQEWKDKFIDSKKFADSRNHQNDRQFFIGDNQVIYPKKVVFTSIDKSDTREILVFEDQINQLKNEYEVTLTDKNIKEMQDQEKNFQIKKFHFEVRLNDNYVYYQRNFSDLPVQQRNPEIGDFRKKFFQVLNEGSYTLIGELKKFKNSYQIVPFKKQIQVASEIEDQELENLKQNNESLCSFGPDPKYLVKQDSIKNIFLGHKTKSDLQTMYQGGFKHQVPLFGILLIFIGIFIILHAQAPYLEWYPFLFSPIGKTGNLIIFIISVYTALAIGGVLWSILWLIPFKSVLKNFIALGFLLLSLAVLFDIYYEYKKE